MLDMKTTLTAISIFLLQALALSAVASPYETASGLPGVRNYFKSDYNAGTQNWAISQDPSGFIYIANNKGLIEYNGASFNLHPIPNGTIVRALLVVGSREILVGAQQEFGLFRPSEDGRLTYHSLLDRIEPKYRQFEDVWKVLRVGEHTVFCTERALFIADAEFNFRVIGEESSRFENFFVVNDQLIIQSKTSGLFRWQGGNELTPIDVDNAVQSRIVAFLPTAKNESLVITESEGAFLFKERTFEPLHGPLSEQLSDRMAVCAVLLSDGRIAIGTPKSGLVIADQNLVPQLMLNTASGLQNNTILNLFEDARNNLWLALDNGLDHVILSTPFTFINEGSGVDGTGYAAEYHHDVLYLGTNQGLYASAWPPDRRDATRFTPIKGLAGQVWNIQTLHDDLFVNMHKGAFLLREQVPTPLYTSDGVWKLNTYPNRIDLLVQGSYTGLSILQREAIQSGDWKPLAHFTDFDESSRVFVVDNTGNIWISHAYKGLFRLSLANNLRSITNIKRYGVEQGLTEELFINVGTVRGEVVFTSPSGIYRFNHLNDRMEVHPDFEGLFGESPNVQRLLEDRFGNIWFSVNETFGVIKPRDNNEQPLQVRYFNQLQEGLVDGFELVTALDANRALVGQENGFVIIDHSKVFDDGFPFPLMITGVRSIFESDSMIYTPDMPSSEAIPLLEHYLNDLQFAYTVPYFEQAKPILYRYKLSGFDRDWSSWTARTDKEYTNLPTGRYTFEVQAMNDFGVVSEPATYTFKILPPWWASTTARVFYALLFVLVSGGFVIGISRHEKRKTDRFKREQIENVKKKEAIFKRESEKTENELMTLRNEKLRADINHKTSQLASATMHLVQKSEILMKLKTDLSKLSDDAPAELGKGLRKLIRTIESDIQLDNNWDQFELYFDQVHENFFKRLRQKFPDLTPKDQKLCAYLRMNLSTKEIAPLLNISVRGVEISRYRVRKKLGIDSETNLVEYIMDI